MPAVAGPPATAGTGVSRISNMDEDAQADLRWVKVAPVSELAPGRGRAFEVDSIPVLLVNDGGSIFALHALCPHQGQNMDGGSVWRGCWR